MENTVDESQSIIRTICKLIGVSSMDDHFDLDIKVHANSAFATLMQLGVGPENGFTVKDKDTKWEEFSDDPVLVEMVKSYMYLKVRILFDPPSSSIVMEAINRNIAEEEWRLRQYVEEVKNGNE